jgi:hypothetical protein
MTESKFNRSIVCIHYNYYKYYSDTSDLEDKIAAEMKQRIDTGEYIKTFKR